MIRVFLADDHAMFREMLKLALPRSGDIEVVGEAEDGRSLPFAVSRARPDIVLLDYKMPDVSDFTALVKQVREREPGPQVVVLSAFAGIELAEQAAQGGARGYVLKSTRLGAVTDAIHTVQAGGVWIDPNLPSKVFEIFQRGTDRAQENPRVVTLTRREHEVLAYVASGFRNRQIAQKLCISEPTVKTHLTRIFEKLAVNNRVAATLAFFGKGTEIAEIG